MTAPTETDHDHTPSVSAEEQVVRAALAGDRLRIRRAAPDLLEALQRLIPTNINLDHPGLGDDVVVPCDVTLGELRAARDAIIKAGG